MNLILPRRDILVLLEKIPPSAAGLFCTAIAGLGKRRRRMTADARNQHWIGDADSGGDGKYPCEQTLRGAEASAF
jgi:hypothetical protein